MTATYLPPEAREQRPKHNEEYLLDRIDYLQYINSSRRGSMARMRDIMNGGRAGLQALLGRDLTDLDDADRQTLPYANLVLRASERIAHRLGRRPELVVDAPTKTDNEGPRKAAEKRARIVEAYDDECRLEMLLPQMGRWLPGYGFAPLVVRDHFDHQGYGYPYAELRDPFDAFPAEWGVQQQPSDMAFVRRVPAERLVQMYPDMKEQIAPKGANWHKGMGGGYHYQGSHTSVGVKGGPGWGNQANTGMDVWELIDDSGSYIVLPDRKLLLDFVPNPLKGKAPFTVIKRFSFDQLAGQFDQAVSLMASMTKFHIMVQIAMEDAVFAPTDIYGMQPPEGYKIGRGVINNMDPGTKVERPIANLPYQWLQHFNKIEDQFRTASGYTEQMDGTSPTSWATGEGLQELATGIDLEIREYQTAFRHGLEQLDCIRLEWDESRFPDDNKPLVGYRHGEPFSENYTPKTHIKGAYRTRRMYGAMAGWDDARKIVTGLQLLQAGVLSRTTFMENIDGLENVTREADRIRHDRILELLEGAMGQRAIEGDPAAIMQLIEELPESDEKASYQKFFTPQEPEMSEEEAAMLAPPAEPLPAQPPDVQSVLSRLSAGGGVEGGVQTVGRV